ncbi:MAG: hypothetical protein IT193_15820 [Propionibacteriaceae bacterium]|nr:hypothetical protein [Propionibacteriaceae bacterium]
MMFGKIARIVAAAALILVAGCGAGAPIYDVGDCLKTSVDSDGKAVKTTCSDKESFEVTKLAKNGGIPNCPYYMPKEPQTDGAAYLTDAVTGVTYCGIHNGPY